MIREYGSCTSVTCFSKKPVTQLLFYSEAAVPLMPEPRRGTLLLRCIYNPFKEAQGIGASGALAKSLINECRIQLTFLKGEEYGFIASEAFNAGEGTSMKNSSP